MWQENYIRGVMTFPIYHIKRHTLSVSPIITDAQFDHVIKMVFTRFLHCKNLSPLVINK